MEFIVIVEAVIAIIAIVCFFIMCGNVAAIRKAVKPEQSNVPLAVVLRLYMSLGLKKEAQDRLVRQMLAEDTLDKTGDYVGRCKSVLDKYSKMIEYVGLTIDEEKLNQK